MLLRLGADRVGICGLTRQEMSARASTNTGSSKLACTKFVSRDFEQIYFEMVYEEFEVIQGLTGCKKPCRYLEYKLLPGGGIPTSFQSNHFVFSLLAQSRLNIFVKTRSEQSSTRYTLVEKEELLYPSSTLVAEVGGTLGLFLGVSFMTLWDGAVELQKYVTLCQSRLIGN